MLTILVLLNMIMFIYIIGKKRDKVYMENSAKDIIMKKVIDNSLENTSATLSLFDNETVSIEEMYNDFSDVMVTLLTNGVENHSSKKFHESLKWYEKCGFISKQKVEMYEKNIRSKKEIAGIVAYAALGIMPLVFNTAFTKKDKENFKKFYIGWLAYVNKVDSVRIRSNVVKMFSTENLNHFDDIFNKYSGEEVKITDLPVLRRKNVVRLNPQDTEKMKLFAGTFLRCCDLQDDGVYRRAQDFLDTQCCLSSLDIERVLCSTSEQVNFLSDFIVYNTVEVKDYMSVVLNSVEKGKNFAYYNIENDPFRKIRQARSELLLDSVTCSSAIVSAIAPEFRPYIVFADMSADLMRKCVDVPSMSASYQIEKARKDMKKAIEDAK